MSESGASSEAEQTLYERIGGDSALTAAVRGLYDEMMKDTRTAHFFAGADVDSIVQHQTMFLTFALGGADAYDGPPIREAHEALELDENDFDALVDCLKNVLMRLDVADDLVDEVVDILETSKNDVLNIEDGEGSRKKKALVTVNYELEEEHCELLKRHFQWLVEAVGSVEDVGSAIYDALFTNAGPEGQKLFVSPKRSTAFRFVTQIQRFVEQCDDIAFLDEELYNMGMRHIGIHM